MKTLAAIFILLSVSLAQNSAPAKGSTVRWDPSIYGATMELRQKRIQKTVTSDAVTVSALVEVTSARHFADPPMEGGADVACIVVGIQNISQQPIHVDPSLITLRAVGKKEQEIRRLKEEQVIDRAWMGAERGGNAVSTIGMTGGSSAAGANTNDAALQAAVSARETIGANRKLREAAAQQTGAQTAKLKERALGRS